MIKNEVLPGSLTALSGAEYFSRLITFGLNAIVIVAFIFFFFNFIMGGISYMSSGGDKGQLQEARNKILNALLGLVVVASTFVVLNFVTGVFGFGFTSFNIAELAL